ncbi:MAG: TonB-dependent receptor family protein [Flavobacteriaceae bacterium]|nr:TonB-dependent receptor family protein [Flavobacteriaceae bacterium]
MKKIVVLFLFFGFTISAQQKAIPKFQITGKIIDKETQQPLEYATVVLTSVRSKKVTGGLTDSKGEFNIEVARGMYNISVEFISFKTYHIPNKKITENINFGTISLEVDSENLDEIEIVAEKTTVEIRLDKKIYNVGKDLTVRGGTVSDVLDNVPSVSVDVEGNVALRGNDNVRILINGKPSGLVGLNSTDALRQLPAEAIEKVEVITSPSARYDAEGTAGILNIILRRSKLQGLNGAITTNIGYPNSAGISGNLNYRTGDFNFFTTSGYNYREVPGNSFNFTEFLNGNDPSTFLEENRTFDRIRKGINVNFGVEWYVNKTASITTSVFYRDSNNESNNTNTIFQIDENGLKTESLRLDPELEDNRTVQYSVNYDKKFKTDGHKLTFDFQYENSSDDENSLITQDGIQSERVRTLENQERILLQTDYVLPIGEKSQFEFGYRGNFNELDTDYTVEFFENGAFELNTDLSNSLIFKENINAVYSQYGSKLKKFSYLFGLRLEATRITIDQITSNVHEVKNYADFFPTINLGYEISEDQNITLGYNRRIRRPRSYFINPFPSRSSATNLFQGNPDLDPSISNAFDIGYLNRFGKLTVNSSIYYQHATDAFNFISEPTGETVTLNNQEVPVVRRTPINLASNSRYGFEFTLTYNPSKKWRLNGDFNLFKSITKGDYNGQNFDADNTSWFIRLNNKITLPGKIDWQTRLSYRGPSENAQNKRKGIFSTNLAFSKDLFKEKASLAFTISDVFNSRKMQTEIFVPEFFTGTSEFQWRERSFNLSFTYRFNQKKKRERQRSYNNGGGEEFGG